MITEPFPGVSSSCRSPQPSPDMGQATTRAAPGTGRALPGSEPGTLEDTYVLPGFQSCSHCPDLRCWLRTRGTSPVPLWAPGARQPRARPVKAAQAAQRGQRQAAGDFLRRRSSVIAEREPEGGKTVLTDHTRCYGGRRGKTRTAEISYRSAGSHLGWGVMRVSAEAPAIMNWH